MTTVETTERLTKLQRYTIRDILPIVRQSRNTVLRAIYDNRLPAQKLGGRWTVTPEDLARYIAGNGDASRADDDGVTTVLAGGSVLVGQ